MGSCERTTTKRRGCSIKREKRRESSRCIIIIRYIINHIVQDLTTAPLTTLDTETLTIYIGNSPCTDN